MAPTLPRFARAAAFRTAVIALGTAITCSMAPAAVKFQIQPDHMAGQLARLREMERGGELSAISRDGATLH